MLPHHPGLGTGTFLQAPAMESHCLPASGFPRASGREQRPLGPAWELGAPSVGGPAPSSRAAVGSASLRQEQTLGPWPASSQPQMHCRREEEEATGSLMPAPHTPEKEREQWKQVALESSGVRLHPPSVIDEALGPPARGRCGERAAAWRGCRGSPPGPAPARGTGSPVPTGGGAGRGWAPRCPRPPPTSSASLLQPQLRSGCKVCF